MADSQVPRKSPNGSIFGSDGIEYHLTPKRVTRPLARELLAAGASLATSVWPEGLAFHIAARANAVWDTIAPNLVVGKSPLERDIQWVGHVWESDEGRVLLHFEGRH